MPENLIRGPGQGQSLCRNPTVSSGLILASGLRARPALRLDSPVPGPLSRPPPSGLFGEAVKEADSVLVQIRLVRTSLRLVVSGALVDTVEQCDSETRVLLDIQPHQQHPNDIRTIHTSCGVAKAGHTTATPWSMRPTPGTATPSGILTRVRLPRARPFRR